MTVLPVNIAATTTKPSPTEHQQHHDVIHAKVNAILEGNNSPEGVVVAPVGTIFRRLNGGVNSTFYVKETGTGSSGWQAKGGAVTAASLGLAPYVNVAPADLPVQTAQLDTAHVIRYTGTAWPSVPASVPAGQAWFDSEGYPAAPAPPIGPRPLALDRDKWFPDHTVA